MLYLLGFTALSDAEAASLRLEMFKSVPRSFAAIPAKVRRRLGIEGDLSGGAEGGKT